MGANHGREWAESRDDGGKKTTKDMAQPWQQKDGRMLDDDAMQEMTSSTLGHHNNPTTGCGVNRVQEHEPHRNGKTAKMPAQDGGDMNDHRVVQDDNNRSFEQPWYEKELKALFARPESSSTTRVPKEKDLFSTFGDDCDLCCCSSSRSRVLYEGNQRTVSSFASLERVSLNGYSHMGMRGIRRSMPNDMVKPQTDLKQNNIPMTAPSRIDSNPPENFKHDVFEITSTSYTILDPQYTWEPAKDLNAKDMPANEKNGENNDNALKVKESAQTTASAINDKRQTPKLHGTQIDLNQTCGSGTVLSPTAKGGHTR